MQIPIRNSNYGRGGSMTEPYPTEEQKFAKLKREVWTFEDCDLINKILFEKGYGVNCVSRVGADLKSHDALQIKRQDAPQLLEQLFRQRLVAEWQAEGKGKAAIIFSHNYKVETIIAAIKRFQKKQEENL